MKGINNIKNHSKIIGIIICICLIASMLTGCGISYYDFNADFSRIDNIRYCKLDGTNNKEMFRHANK